MRTMRDGQVAYNFTELESEVQNSVLQWFRESGDDGDPMQVEYLEDGTIF